MRARSPARAASQSDSLSVDADVCNITSERRRTVIRYSDVMITNPAIRAGKNNLNQIVLDIDAVAGAGNLPGNLLCSVAGLLDGGALSNVGALLTRILSILG